MYRIAIFPFFMSCLLCLFQTRCRSDQTLHKQKGVLLLRIRVLFRAMVVSKHPRRKTSKIIEYYHLSLIKVVCETNTPLWSFFNLNYIIVLLSSQYKRRMLYFSWESGTVKWMSKSIVSTSHRTRMSCW